MSILISGIGNDEMSDECALGGTRTSAVKNGLKVK